MTPTDLYKDPSLIDWANPIVADFETYYDKEYSLKKVTTEKYIRCDKFECIGLAIKNGSEPTEFYPREHGVEVLKAMCSKHPNRPVVFQNSTFDAGILAFRYGIHPNFTVDTVVMAKLSGFDRAAGGSSLAKMSALMEKLGIYTAVKGTAVHDMLGVHADDMTSQQWQAYGDYCKLDVDLTYALYMYLLDKVPVSELIMADITTKMWTQSKFVIDEDLLIKYREQLQNSKQERLSNLARELGLRDTNELLTTLRSSSKFTQVLSKYVEVPMKWSEKKNEYVPALAKTDKKFLELLEHENPKVSLLVETKLGVSSSLAETRATNFLDVASRGVFPVALRYASAHTGRYGGGDGSTAKGGTNVQNLPKRTGDLTLRRSLKAADGHVVLACDASQVELRLNALLAGQDDLVDIFLSGRDPYVDMATTIFNKSYDEIYHEAKVVGSKEGKRMRNIGKEVCLACGYGMSVNTFRSRMQLTGQYEAANMADELVPAFRNKNAKIPHFWRTCGQALEVMLMGGSMSFGGPNNDLFVADGSTVFHGVRIPTIRLPNGQYIFYQNLRKEVGDDGRINFVYDQFKGNSFVPTRLWGSMVDENICQAISFVVLKWQAIEMAKNGLLVGLNVHDEWVAVVPRSEAEKACVVMYTSMKSVPDYIPQGLLDCELDIGVNYADLTTLDMASVMEA